MSKSNYKFIAIFAIILAVFTAGFKVVNARIDNPSSGGGSGASIGGTFTDATAGSVIFAGSGTFAQDNASFFFDDTNNKLGLATTTPWAQLSINPTSANGTAPSFVVGSSTATHFMVGNNGNVAAGGGSAVPTFPFQFIRSVNGVLTIYVQNSVSSTAADVQLLMGVRGTLYDQTTGASIYADRTDAASQFGSTDLLFKNSIGNSLNTSMIIKDTGLTGFGATSTPWGLVSINPTALTNGNIFALTGPSFVIGSSTATNFIVSNAGTVGMSTTTPSAQAVLSLGINRNVSGSASTTVRMHKIQFEGLNSAGTLSCTYLVGTAWVAQAGACNN